MNRKIARKEYGHIEIKLDALMEKYGVTHRILTLMTGMQPEMIEAWRRNKVDRIDLGMLKMLCYTFECDVSDILRYIPCLEEE